MHQVAKINWKSAIGNRKCYGGEGGIRTHGTVSRSQHFQCCQFNHSCTSPEKMPIADLRLSTLKDKYQSAISNQKSAMFWRRGWDSNPRWALTHSGFRDRCTNPLCDLSNCCLGAGTARFRRAVDRL